MNSQDAGHVESTKSTDWFIESTKTEMCGSWPVVITIEWSDCPPDRLA